MDLYYLKPTTLGKFTQLGVCIWILPLDQCYTETAEKHGLYFTTPLIMKKEITQAATNFDVTVVQ